MAKKQTVWIEHLLFMIKHRIVNATRMSSQFCKTMDIQCNSIVSKRLWLNRITKVKRKIFRCKISAILDGSKWLSECCFWFNFRISLHMVSFLNCRSYNQFYHFHANITCTYLLFFAVNIFSMRKLSLVLYIFLIFHSW